MNSTTTHTWNYRFKFRSPDGRINVTVQNASNVEVAKSMAARHVWFGRTPKILSTEIKHRHGWEPL